MDTLVSTAWLSEHLDDDDLIVLDCTVKTVEEEGGLHNHSGRPGYDAGHIPGAGFADLFELCDPEPEFAVPAPQRFCDAMGELGVGDESRVVLYDRGLSFWAARVWWMLRWIGFDRAALLDGGFKVWRAEDRPLSVAPDNHPARTLSCNLRPSLIANRDQVREAIDDDDVQLIDTLPEPSYRGEMTLYGRPGHIPGAVNLCTMALLDESGRYRPDAELAAMHSFDPDSRTITYCGGGIMASASAFAMTRLGYRDVAVYTASLQEWAADPDNPMTS